MTQASSQIEEAGGQPPEDGGRRKDGRDEARRSSGFRFLACRCWSRLSGFWRLRADKSSWRIRLVAAGFAVLYLVIGLRLVYLGSEPEPPQTLKSAASDTVSEARPDVLDRNGEILATDVKVMSVFAEPRRIIDIDDAVDLLRGVLPDLDAQELARAARLAQGFRLDQARHHAEGTGRNLPSRPARHRLPAGEPARLPERADRCPCSRLHRCRQQGHRRHREIYRRTGPRRPQRLRLPPDARGFEAASPSPSTSRRPMRFATNSPRASKNSRRSPERPPSWTSIRGRSSPSPRCRISIRTIPSTRANPIGSIA